MKNIILGLVLIISPALLFGHNPLSARYYLETSDKASLLSINLSQDGINHLLSKKLGVEKMDSLSAIELKEVIIDYVKSNFTLLYDAQEIKLAEGGIKLGSHQTDLKFVLPPIPTNTLSLTVSIPAFKENENHQTIFSYQARGINDHVILSHDNNYKATISLSEQTASMSNVCINYGLIGLACILLVLFVGKRLMEKQVLN